MSKKYIFKADVPGEYGDNTILDDRFYPSKIYHVDYLFDRHPDDIFKNGRRFFLLDSLYNKIIDLGLSGIDNPRLITYKMNPQFYDINPNKEIPQENYYFVDIIGNENDDFHIEYEPDFILIISERALELFKISRINFAKWEVYRG